MENAESKINYNLTTQIKTVSQNSPVGPPLHLSPPPPPHSHMCISIHKPLGATCGCPIMDQAPTRCLGYSAVMNNAAVNMSVAYSPCRHRISVTNIPEVEWMAHSGVHILRLFIQILSGSLTSGCSRLGTLVPPVALRTPYMLLTPTFTAPAPLRPEVTMSQTELLIWPLGQFYPQPSSILVNGNSLLLSAGAKPSGWFFLAQPHPLQ